MVRSNMYMTAGVPNASSVRLFVLSGPALTLKGPCSMERSEFVNALRPLPKCFQAAVLIGLDPEARGWVLDDMARKGYDAGTGMSSNVLTKLGVPNILTARYNVSDTLSYIAGALLMGKKQKALIDLLVSPLSSGKSMYRLWDGQWSGKDSDWVVEQRTKLLMAMTDTQLMTVVSREPGLKYYESEGVAERMPGILSILEGINPSAEAVLMSIPLKHGIKIFGDMERDAKISVLENWGSKFTGANGWTANSERAAITYRAEALIGGNPDVLEMIKDGTINLRHHMTSLG